MQTVALAEYGVRGLGIEHGGPQAIECFGEIVAVEINDTPVTLLGRMQYLREILQEQFALADIDGRGQLTLNQFRMFSDTLGLGLSKRESEATFMKIDKDRSGRISFEEVQKWWAKGKQ